ncbi:MAG TPA: hypothetical protein VHI30_02320 [Gaiellales bacterium]|jgi:hypothetical protein|nr:hypothetical protein [Gaiellales bacterium]
MTPAEFIHALSIVNERLKTARTVAISLLAFAALALAGTYGVKAVQPGMAKTMAAIAVIGGLGAIVVGRVLRLHRTELLDDILLSGFRHVGGPDVGRRAAELVTLHRRRQLAETLERFVEVAATNDPCSVPLHRPALREMAPKVLELTHRLREPDTRVQPSGMVLVRRLVTDGCQSPIFAPVGPPRDLERALDRIHAELGYERLERVLRDDGEDTGTDLRLAA